MSNAQNLPLYCQIPRDLASSIHFVCEGYSEMLDLDDVRVTSKRIRCVRRLLERNNNSALYKLTTLSISFCVFPNAAACADLKRLIQSKTAIKSLTFSHNDLQGDADLNFLLESLRERDMEEIELHDRSIYGANKFLDSIFE